MVKRQRIEELYFIRAISAFGIFMIHATGGFALYSQFNSNAMHISILLNQFFRFGTPVFMIVSGFVLFYNYRNLNEFNAKKFYIKKLKFLLLPYIVWSILYFLYINYYFNTQITIASIITLIKKIPFGDTYAHLYFIFLIFQFYLLFPIIIKVLGKYMKRSPLKVFICLFLIQGSVLLYAYYFKAYGISKALDFFNKYYWKSVFGWFYYFILGGIIAFHYENIVDFINKKIKVIIIGYVLSSVLFLGEVYFNIVLTNGRDYYENFGSIRPANMLYAVCTFCILVYLTRKITIKNSVLIEIPKSFGTYSLGIYFSHPMILSYVTKVLTNSLPKYISYQRTLSMIIIVAIGWISTILFCYLIALFNNRWILIGKVPKLKLDSFMINNLVKSNN